jgi:hypothetical protein
MSLQVTWPEKLLFTQAVTVEFFTGVNCHMTFKILRHREGNCALRTSVRFCASVYSKPVLTNGIVLTPIQIRLSVLMPIRIQNLPQVFS